MGLFNRKSKQSASSMPPEVQEYYQSERRGRMGMAWLLSAVTFVGTVLVVLGLFYSGRWVYRSVTNDDNKTVTQTQQGNTKLFFDAKFLGQRSA